jgi:hypothetical protein
MDCERWSPLTRARQVQARPGGTSRPSASADERHRQAGKRPAHRFQARLADIAAVDAVGRNRRHGDAKGLAQHLVEQRVALGGCKALGIVQPRWNVAGVEHHGGSDNRAGEGAASGFVEARAWPQATRYRFRFEGEVGLVDEFEEGRRIGARASHGAAMLASAPILRKTFPAD